MKQVTFNFIDKRFVVTGASSGMGRQIVLDLAEAGALVLGLARRKEALDEVRSHNAKNIRTAVCDVTDKEAIETAVSSFVAECGKLHGCVHAAGVNVPTPLRIYDVAAAHDLMEISFWGGVNLVQCVTKTKYAEKGSSSILFSSIAAQVGEKSMFAYSAAKSAVCVAAKTFAKELAAKGHRVVSLSPGWVATEMTSKSSDFQAPQSDRCLLGYGKPEDVAGMVLFLLSDKARWITGTDIVVDGGYLA